MVKEVTQCRRCEVGFLDREDPPGEGKWQPTLDLAWKIAGQRSLADESLWVAGVRHNEVTKQQQNR